MKCVVDWREWSDEEGTHRTHCMIVDAESRKEAKEIVADKIGWDVPTNVERLS